MKTELLSAVSDIQPFVFTAAPAVNVTSEQIALTFLPGVYSAGGYSVFRKEDGSEAVFYANDFGFISEVRLRLPNIPGLNFNYWPGGGSIANTLKILNDDDSNLDSASPLIVFNYDEKENTEIQVEPLNSTNFFKLAVDALAYDYSFDPRNIQSVYQGVDVFAIWEIVYNSSRGTV